MNTIQIASSTLTIKEWNNQRVVTFKDIDTVHGRPDGTARKRFHDNKKHFIEGEDYFVRKTDEARREFGISAPNGLTLITETGYLMLVKSFTDDLAWDVQRQLVKSYFRANPAEEVQLELPTDVYDYYNKTWNGIPVVTIEDLVHILGVSEWAIRRCISAEQLQENVDFVHLCSEKLAAFKRENPKIRRNCNNMLVITKTGFQKICSRMKVQVESPLLFIEHKTEVKRLVFPHSSMKKLMGYVQSNAKRILSLSDLLLMEDCEENLELYRNQLVRAMQHLNAYTMDVKTIYIKSVR